MVEQTGIQVEGETVRMHLKAADIIIRPLGFPVGFWRDDDYFPRSLKRMNDPLIRIKGFLGNHRICGNRRQ